MNIYRATAIVVGIAIMVAVYYMAQQ